MRTTIEIPDSLFRRAKLAAVEEETTLKDLVARGLEEILGGKASVPAYRLSRPPVRLAPDSPLAQMRPGELGRIDAETEAEELDEVYRGR